MSNIRTIKNEEEFQAFTAEVRNRQYEANAATAEFVNYPDST